MKKNTVLIFVSVIAITLPIVSQLAWVQLLVRRDKERFEIELKQTVQSIVSFCLSKEVANNLERLNIEIKPANQDEIYGDMVIRGSFDTKEYQSDKNLGNFLVGAFAEDLLNENKISLEPMDSLFRREFEPYSEIAVYSMTIQKNNSILREIYEGKNANRVLSDSTTGVTVVVPLGQSGQYVHKTHMVFKPTIFTQHLRSVSLLSAVAIIIISLLVMYQLLRLKRKTEELALHKKAVSGLVHDLKSPLSYVYTLLGTFERSEQDTDRKSRFFKSKTRVKHLSEKIEGLLLTLKNRESGLKVHQDMYPITKRCLEIMDELRVIYSNKQIQFGIEPTEEVEIMADPVYFDCCVRNLLDNGVKYSDNTPNIKVQIEKGNNRIRLSFTDKGQGISPKHRKKVFREFYRTGRESSVKNHGIGLAFTKQVVCAHSGKIWLESTPQKGSTFTITLPQ